MANSSDYQHGDALVKPPADLKLYTCTLFIDEEITGGSRGKEYWRLLHGSNPENSNRSLYYSDLIKDYERLSDLSVQSKSNAETALNQMFTISEIEAMQKRFSKNPNYYFKYYEEELPVDSENYWRGIGRIKGGMTDDAEDPVGFTIWACDNNKGIGYDFDHQGYDYDGYNCYGWNKNGINRVTGTKFDATGHNRGYLSPVI